MNRPDLHHRVVLLSGASRGLGRAIAHHLASQGAAVGLLARSRESLDDAVRSIRQAGGLAEPFPADVLDPQAVELALRRFRDWSKNRCDALVCAAGRLRAIAPIGLVDPEAWTLDLTTPLVGSMRLIRGLVSELRQSPLGSITLLVGPGLNGELANASAYASAQAGLVRLAETLDAEFQPLGPRVYAINPGIVPTPLMEHVLQSPEGRKWLPRFTEAFAEGKEVGPEPAADLVAWLISRRPPELGGRVVAALGVPDFLETRLSRIEAEDLGRLRLR